MRLADRTAKTWDIHADFHPRPFPLACRELSSRESAGRSNGAVSCSALPERNHKKQVDEYYEARLESGERRVHEGDPLAPRLARDASPLRPQNYVGGG